MDVARRNQQNPGSASGVGEGVDRCRATAAGASYKGRPPSPT
jgi:hypothetical protein